MRTICAQSLCPAARPTHPPLVTTGAGQGLAPGLGCGCQLAPAGWVVWHAEPPPSSVAAPGLTPGRSGGQGLPRPHLWQV